MSKTDVYKTERKTTKLADLRKQWLEKRRPAKDAVTPYNQIQVPKSSMFIPPEPVRAKPAPQPTVVSEQPTPQSAPKKGAAILSGPMTMRRAVIMKEILDKPLALRRR